MKVAPVSADLLIKLGLVAAAGVALLLLLRKVQSSLPSADSIAAAAQYVNPASNQNVVNQGVSAVGGALVSDTGPGRNADGSWTLGGWLYDITHADPLKAPPPASGGYTGNW